MSKSKKHKFKPGDRVVYRITDGGPGNSDLEGRHGTVIYVDNTPAPYTVEFDESYCDGVTDYRVRQHGKEPKTWHGWFCREGNLQKERRRTHESLV